MLGYFSSDAYTVNKRQSSVDPNIVNVLVCLWDWCSLCSFFLSLSGASCHKDIAASTSRCHSRLSIARHLAVARPKLSRRRSSSTVLSQVCLGLPVLHHQSAPLRIVSDRSGCPVRDRTTSSETKSVQWDWCCWHWSTSFQYISITLNKLMIVLSLFNVTTWTYVLFLSKSNY